MSGVSLDAPDSRDADLAPLLAARDVSKHFGGVAAVRDVTIEFPAGTVTAIVGDNGAGKSTLMKMLCGVHLPDEGTLEVRGEPVRLANPTAAHHLGIETVHQDLALADHRDVAQNLFLGRELRRRVGPLQLLDVGRMRREAETALRDLRVKLPSVRQEVRKLSGGQRQGVAIARAVHWGSKILLLDEPMAALGLQEQARVQELIADLASRGLTIVIVSHNLDHVFALSTRIAVMRLGRLVTLTPTAATTPVEVLHRISGIAEAG